MRDAQTIIDAYRTLLGAMEELPPANFTREEALRIEGAADAMNWVLNRHEDLATVFEGNIKRLAEARQNARLPRMLSGL